jgi:lipopolysaccharide export system protein LptA
MTKLPAIAFAAAAFALSAQAAEEPANPITKGMLNPDAPIEWAADNFVGDAVTKEGTFTGNVVIRQGEVRMRADAVRVHVVQNKPDKIYAQGNVVVDTPSGIATGDSGVYDVNPRIITLKGRVVLTKDKNVMRGRQLVVNLITGVATLDSSDGTGGRIQGLFSSNANASGKH